MKHILVFLLIFCLMAGCVIAHAAYFSDNGGAEFVLKGSVTGTLLADPSALDPRTGPGPLYDALDPGLLLLEKGSEIKILTQVYSGGVLWVLAEVPSFYRDIRCYLVARNQSECIRFDHSAVPEEAGPDNLTSTWGCMSYEYEAYRFGPGDEYAFTGSSLSPDDTAWIILKDGDWALVESSNRYNGASTVFARRGWVLFDRLCY